MKRKNLLKRKPPARREGVRAQNTHDVRGKPVSVRSVSGLAYPVRGALGRQLAEERS
jgi:hypothetical protein